MLQKFAVLCVSLLSVVAVPGPHSPVLGQEEPPAWSAPPIRNAVTVRDGHTGETISFDDMLSALAAADAVFLGEQHTDETTHRVELAVYEGLLERRNNQVVLAMEMFERDVQKHLDQYLAGEIDEATFQAQSRPWGNYRTAYRYLVERAKQAGRPVIASNFPRPIRTRMAQEGNDVLKNLEPDEVGLVPRQFLPNTDDYWRRVDNAVRGHLAMMRGGTDPESRLYSTQSLWDNSMGEACADALDKYPGNLVLHVNGGFHSEYWDGTVHQLKLRKPQATIKTVAIVPTPNPAVVQWEGAPVADYLVLAESRASDLRDGTFSVYGQQEIKYRLHVPHGATADKPVPLMIYLCDDGFSSTDGLDLWKERLGDDVAIAIVEPPYRETQEDFGIGGRWFWPDSFGSDVGTIIDAVETIWAYVARHFPVDPARVCVIGEGTGATVAASVLLLVDRMDLQGIAVGPRQYSKIKDFSLPLPGPGDTIDLRKTLTVILAPEDESWWSGELQQYQEVGVTGTTELRSNDPWQIELQQENAIRHALQLPDATPPTGAVRRYIAVPTDAPRARHWARLHALWAQTETGQPVAVVDQPPDDAQATAIQTDLQPQTFAASGALPPCPGPFGGTTVIVLPAPTDEQRLAAWMSIQENDPLTKTSRFHRLRIATTTGPGNLREVLTTLQSENRKNILIVPAVFYADPNWLRVLKVDVRDLENQMTLQWLPGLGGRKISLTAGATAATDLPVKHALSVVLLPDTHQIRVRDRISLPASLAQEGAEFTLSDALTISTSYPTLETIEDPAASGRARYRLKSEPVDGVLELTYDGTVQHGLSDQKEEYTRGFRETGGIVGQEGVYLDADSQWVPQFNEQLIQFSLEVETPPTWQVISQGNGTARDEQGIARWDSAGLVEQVYLVGGPLLRYTDAAGAIEAQVYLHEADEALARKYLDATAGYLEMYRELIGPYPYSKFALVENFWETGYGMPSFTLLGPQVIRFPFILTSSYPHEILHNWWGNSVFVDYESGNWCEGLTAYLADHLIQEQRGLGSDYRRSTLQKYRDYVKEGRDFPLTEFRSRHNAATEAVGYGKALMMDHMLRRQIGDDQFRSALAGFYRKYRGQRASFDDLRAAFEEVTQADLGPFFAQWTQRAGAPVLAVADVTVRQIDNGFHIAGRLLQTQDGQAYQLEVPLTVVTTGDQATTVVTMRDKTVQFAVDVASAPQALHIDPMFDLFRLLDPRETPPSIGQIFGDPGILAVLPSAASNELQAEYRQLMQAWATDTHAIEVVLDRELASLPDNRSVWILGKENRYAPALIDSAARPEDVLTAAAIRLAGEEVAFANNSIVSIHRHPVNMEKAVGLLVIDPPAAFAGMARKLPHYGKYSYLAFEGDEPTNFVKGQSGGEGSPLAVDLRSQRDGSTPVAAAEKRPALAELPPVFSSSALAAHVNWLSAPERQGRGLGSDGLRASAEYIAQQMADIGLQPGGDEGTWYQPFTVAEGPDGQPVQTVNVIGVMPGKREDWKDQSIVLGAHYDHLGFGWPDVRAAFQGQLHPGADDNASGVAVLLELARNLIAEEGGSRNLVFVAFSAEECGRLGSQYYVQHPRFPAGEIRGVINLDTVGRLRDGKLAIHAAGTADEWQHIFRGCGFVTGIPNQIVPDGGEASDQMSFIEQGIPAVQIFTGAHGDYHRPSDTPDQVDMAGLVKVATFVKEAVVYLLEREPPMTVRIAGAEGVSHPATVAPGGGRRVMFGTVPAFDYQGQGVKVDSTVPDSPAAQAGLQPGDVIVQVDQQKINNLMAFSEFLKTLQPNQTITVEIQRDGAPLTIKVTVVQR